MNRIGAASVAVLVLAAASGCVSKSKFEESQAKVAACEAERTQAVAAAASCQENVTKEAARWDALTESLTKEAPAVLENIQNEKAEFLRQLPEAVRTQVDSYLEKFSGDVRKAFALMRDENQKMAAKLAEVGDTAGRTEGKADIIIGRIEERERALVADAGRVQQGIADVIGRIGEFDRTMINCRDCDDRLVLSRKERETISAFHSQMVEALTGLRTPGTDTATAPAPATSGGR
jgi:hypothetical protein